MKAIILIPERGYAERWAWAYDVEAAALTAHGIEVEPRPWTEPGDVADTDIVLPLVAWGYNQRYADWLSLLDRAERERWPMVNPPALLRWNSDKAYLTMLGANGIATVATIAVDALDDASLAAARLQLGGDSVVVKPPVSGGADGTYRLAPGAPIPADVVGQRMMVQPFERGIADGEWSMILFGDAFSHCVLKRPRPDDFRVQPQHGGTDTPCPPPDGALELARRALGVAPAPATYARVDMLRRSDGALAIMELELIEPALFLHHAPDGGRGFAEAVESAARALGAKQ